MKRTILLLVALLVSMAGTALADDGQCVVVSRTKLLGFIPWEDIHISKTQKAPNNADEMIGAVEELFRNNEVRSHVDLSAPVLAVGCAKNGNNNRFFLWSMSTAGHTISEGEFKGPAPESIRLAIVGNDNGNYLKPPK